MRHSVRRGWMVMLACSLAAATAIAQDIKSNDDTADPVEVQKACNLNGYKSETIKYDPAVAIPDNNAGGVTLGPLSFPDDGTAIADVILSLQATHTYVGDLKVTLRYDLGCDASIDAQSVVLCRPRGTQSSTPAPCGTGTGFGCSGNLDCSKEYKFDDGGTAFMAQGSCPSTISQGCYKPSSVGGTPLAAFADMRKNGCWTLHIADLAAQDIGTVCEWTVHLYNHEAVGVEGQTWGQVKVLYRD